MKFFADYIHNYSYQHEMLRTFNQELPELRFGQAFVDFFEWLKKQGKDPYYIEDSLMYSYFKEYINSIKRRKE